MPINIVEYHEIDATCKKNNVALVAVSKTKPLSEIIELYQLGQRDFGENYVQELAEKHAQLPTDIRWHFIGHLQSNKVKYIVPFVHLIHGVDSMKLLKEINKQAAKYSRVIKVLLQVHIAKEETKFGLDELELKAIIDSSELQELRHVKVCGLMGMASFSDDLNLVREEFKYLKSQFDIACQLATANCQLQILSMGMSGDFKIAIEEGSNMVRIGSLIFGNRIYKDSFK